MSSNLTPSANPDKAGHLAFSGRRKGYVMNDIPRPGLLGVWDRLVGPGMTRSETSLVLMSCALGAACAAARMSAIGAEWYIVVLAGLMGFDLVGGAVCNATDTTKA